MEDKDQMIAAINLWYLVANGLRITVLRDSPQNPVECLVRTYQRDF